MTEIFLSINIFLPLGETEGHWFYLLLVEVAEVIEPNENVGSKSVVTACMGSIVFPKSTGAECHIIEVASDILLKLLLLTRSHKKVKSEIVTDEGVCKVDLGPLVIDLSLRAEIV